MAFFWNRSQPMAKYVSVGYTTRPPASSTATARATWRGCGCSASIGWMGACRDTAALFPIGAAPTKNGPGALSPSRPSSAATVLRLLGLAVQRRIPLALLDQLADLLATLVADLRVELRTARRSN